MSKRWRCTDCGEVRREDALLKAPSPFDPDETLVGCPGCKSIDHFAVMCEVVGCKNDGRCGTPESFISGDTSCRYVQVCGEHMLWLEGAAKHKARHGLEFHEP